MIIEGLVVGVSSRSTSMIRAMEVLAGGAMALVYFEGGCSKKVTPSENAGKLEGSVWNCRTPDYLGVPVRPAGLIWNFRDGQLAMSLDNVMMLYCNYEPGPGREVRVKHAAQFTGPKEATLQIQMVDPQTMLVRTAEGRKLKFDRWCDAGAVWPEGHDVRFAMLEREDLPEVKKAAQPVNYVHVVLGLEKTAISSRRISMQFDTAGLRATRSQAGGRDRLMVNVNNARLEFAAPVGETLEPAEFAVQSGGGDASPTITLADGERSVPAGAGRFRILEIESDAAGKVLRLALDFFSREGEVPSAGMVRWNAGVE